MNESCAGMLIGRAERVLLCMYPASKACLSRNQCPGDISNLFFFFQSNDRDSTQYAVAWIMIEVVVIIANFTLKTTPRCREYSLSIHKSSNNRERK